MNYQKIYEQLVEKAKPRGLDKSKLEGYFEKHHIVPKCLGGDDSPENFVLFTAKEHVIAHHLLWKANPENYSLMWTYSRTLHTKNGEIKNLNKVAYLREKKAKYMSERYISPETKQKISKTLTGKKRTPESIEKGRLKQIGQKRSEETCKKLSEKRRELIESGWTVPESARESIGNFFRGRPISEEHKRKISEANVGKVIEDEHKKALSEYQKSLKPWEKSSVKAREDRYIVWKTADELFDKWVELGRKGCRSLSVEMGRLHGVEYPVWKYETLVDKFKEGWVPQEDLDWLSFRDFGYPNDETRSNRA